jgi:hypothetical protein
MFVPAYFQNVFSSRGVSDTLSLFAIGATMANLNAGIVARLRMPLPPAEEQGRIVKLVETENQRTERAPPPSNARSNFYANTARAWRPTL